MSKNLDLSNTKASYGSVITTRGKSSDQTPMTGDLQQPSQIYVQLDVMQGELAELAASINSLEMRLNPILRDVEPEKSGTAQVEEIVVTLAQAIRERRYMVNNLRSRVGSMLERLEL